MNTTKNSAQALFNEFRKKGSDEDRLKLTEGMPGFFDEGVDNKEHSLVRLLKARWNSDTKNDALRRALFVGSLDELMELRGNPKTETLVRYFDNASGLDRVEPIGAFLGAQSTPNARAGVDEGARLSIDMDYLTRGFLKDCFSKVEDGYALPRWGGVHIENTKGSIRALAWLQSPPAISISQLTGDHEFPVGENGFLKFPENAKEAEEIQSEKLKRTVSAQGTGINEYTAFVWCNHTLAELNDSNFKADDLMRSISLNYHPESGKVMLDTFSLDHVSLRKLAEKAKTRGVIGPLRLSANALMLDPLTSSVIVQRKREPKRSFPFHTFGGSFLVADPMQRENYVPTDEQDLVRCVRREVLEESNVALPLSSRRPYKDIPALLLLQTDPPFLQTCFLGWQVPLAEIEQGLASNMDEGGMSNSEGSIVPMPLTPMENKKWQSVAETFYEGEGARKAWRPAGLFALYTWYKIGCPGVGAEAKARLEEELTKMSWTSS